MKHICKPLFILLLISAVAPLSYFAYHQINNNLSSESRYYAHQLELKKKYGHLSEEEIKKLPKKDRPDLAMLQEFEMTKDPALGYPPTYRKLKAFQYAKSLLAKKSQSNASGINGVDWVERGPNNVGGRTRAIMWDPNDVNNKKVWAGSVSGGLWYNNDVTDASSAWVAQDDFMSNLAASTLAYDPSNTQTFYLGTGEGYNPGNGAMVLGLGIYKSTDGGANWAILNSTEVGSSFKDFEYTQKIEVTSVGTVLAATRAGLMRSIDGGANWTTPSGMTGAMADIEIAANGDIYAGTFGGVISKSTDDGETFTSVTSGTNGRVEIATAPSNSDVVYALFVSGSNVGDFKKSTDGGANWTDLTAPMYTTQSCTLSGTDDFTRGQAWYDLIIGVHPTDADNVIIGGIDLYRTIDGGANWELISYWTGACDVEVHADQHAIEYRPGNPDEALFGNDGGIYYSADISSVTDPDFESRNNGYNVTQFYACAIKNDVAGTYFLAGAQDNGSQQFTEAAINSTTEVTGGDGAFCFIDQDEPNVQITSYVYNNYRISTNDFASFTTFGVGNDNGRFINPADYDSKQNILYAAGNSGELIRYSGIPNSIQSTILTPGIAGTISNILVSPYTDNKLYIGSGNGDIYIIEDADQATPTVTQIRTADGSYISSIDIGETENDLLITANNYGIISVYISTDGGSNWIDKEDNLPDMPVRWGIFNPNNYNQVLLATETGVWSTTDIMSATPNWEPTSDGLANVRCDMLQYREADGLIAVATFGRGLFTTISLSNSIEPAFTIEADLIYAGATVQFTNTSVGSINNYDWDFGDGNTSTAFEPSYTYNVPGTYDITLGINNNEKAVQKKITVLPKRPIPYTPADGGDFESNTDDFHIVNETGTPFELGSSTIDGKNGTSSGSNAWVTGINESNYQDNSQAYIYSPGFDFSAAGTYTLSFDANYAFEDNWDGFIVEYSIDYGKTWTKLGTDVVEANWYNQISDADAIWGNQVPIFSGSTSGFETKSYDVSSLSGNSGVAFRVNFGTDANTTDVGMAIDDFEVDGPQSNAVADFSSTNPTICEGESITYYDNSSGSISAYSWDFGVNASPTSATGPGPHEVTYATAGNYDAALTVTGDLNGDVTETKVTYVTVVSSSSINNTVTTGSTELNTCSSTGVDITIVSSNVGVQYQLFDNASGLPLSGYEVGDGNDLTLTTSVVSESTTVEIVATSASGCESVLSTMPTITFVGPSDKTVTSDYTEAICAEEEVTFTIAASDNNVTYQLLDTSDDSLVGSSVEGDGSDITITTGAISATVTVKLTATLTGTSCTIDVGSPLEIEIKPMPDATITLSGNTVNAESGSDAYQWYFDGAEITGATGNSYVTTYAGDYSVEVTLNGCTATSDAFPIAVTGIEDYKSAFKIYPNPSNDGMITLASPLAGEVNVYSTTGKMIYHGNSTIGDNIIDLSAYSQGIYIMEIKQGDNIFKERISLMK